jgi:hypothetical protein
VTGHRLKEMSWVSAGREQSLRLRPGDAKGDGGVVELYGLGADPGDLARPFEKTADGNDGNLVDYLPRQRFPPQEVISSTCRQRQDSGGASAPRQ